MLGHFPVLVAHVILDLIQRIRTLYSLALIGDARAIDYTAVKVDGEPQRKTPLEIGDEARREYRRVMMALPPKPWVTLVVQRWQQIVAEEAAKVKAAFGL